MFVHVPTALNGGAGHDYIRGGFGNDLIVGGMGNDRIDGGLGDDIVVGGDGNDDIKGGGGNDVLSGGSGRDNLKGGSGHDILIGGNGRDNLNGGKGDDLLIADIWANQDMVASLDSLQSVWTGSGSYESRRNTLTAAGGLLNASTFTNDGDRDRLKGDKGRDLFFVWPNDRIGDRRNDEDLFVF